MQHVVFYRNVNLGRPRCPSKAQLEDAYRRAGALTASSFLTNGTLVFSLPPRRSVARVVRDATATLHDACGLVEPAFVRSLTELEALVAQDPFALVDPKDVYERCVSFFSADVSDLSNLPLASRNGDVEILALTPMHALSLSRKRTKSPGSPNAFLEKQLGIAATTRSFNTVRRLVEKFAR